jgi:hypothetical protein
VTTPANEIPVSVDYTSRDFYSLRSDLIARIQANVNVPNSGVTWSANDPADFGVALVEAFAYMGDVTNYYIDRIANENYLSTATQRQNIINLAKVYGYNPSSYKSASCSVVFYNTGNSDVTVPAGTQVSGQVVVNDAVEELVFTTQSAVVAPAAVDGTAGASSAVIALHGQNASTLPNNDPNYGEAVGISDGTPSQTFMLAENQVVEGSVKVFVEIGSGTTYAEWQPVTHLSDSGPTDSVYTIDIDANNYVYVTFGDGISGAIPSTGKSIKVDYTIGGGAVGNVTTNVLTTIYSIPVGYTLPNIEVSNTTVGVGGSEPESNTSIRYNAPRALTTLNRAVTLLDYASLALQVTNVGKSNAIAESKNSVTLYVSPQQNSDVTDLYPGFTGDPTAGGTLDSVTWSGLSQGVTSYLSNKTQIGVSVTVSPPSYVPVHLGVQFTKRPQYTNDAVKANILATLINRFSYNNMIFGDLITPEEVEAQIRQADGVYNAKVLLLARPGATGRNVLQGTASEIFVFDEPNLDINPASSDSTLSALSSNHGTLSPSFASDHLNYNLLIADSTTSVTLTAVSSTASITVNGTAYDSVLGAVVTTPVGVTTANVVVLAQDGFTTQTYRIAITRNA